jgi:hypothetical protein
VKIQVRIKDIDSQKAFKIMQIMVSKADGSYIKEIARIEKQDLLILDDFGYSPAIIKVVHLSWKL